MIEGPVVRIGGPERRLSVRGAEAKGDGWDLPHHCSGLHFRETSRHKYAAKLRPS